MTQRAASLRWTKFAAGAAVVAAVLASCEQQGPRVKIFNDRSAAMHIFYCADKPCRRGISGNDQIVQPGQSADDFWNSPDPTGPVGVATYPGDILLGCLNNPSEGEDAPLTKTLFVSSVETCPAGDKSAGQKVSFVNPGS